MKKTGRAEITEKDIKPLHLASVRLPRIGAKEKGFELRAAPTPEGSILQVRSTPFIKRMPFGPTSNPVSISLFEFLAVFATVIAVGVKFAVIPKRRTEKQRDALPTQIWLKLFNHQAQLLLKTVTEKRSWEKCAKNDWGCIRELVGLVLRVYMRVNVRPFDVDAELSMSRRRHTNCYM